MSKATSSTKRGATKKAAAKPAAAHPSWIDMIKVRALLADLIHLLPPHSTALYPTYDRQAPYAAVVTPRRVPISCHKAHVSLECGRPLPPLRSNATTLFVATQSRILPRC